MKSALIIHGTEGYPEENWFPWCKQQLEKHDYHVVVPQFPSPPVVPANIEEWFEVLSEYQASFNQDTLIIGHSLGGLFTLRILEQIQVPIKLAAVVGAPIGCEPILNYERDSAFCGFEFNWNKIRAGAQNFVVFQSDDDPYVGLENGRQLAEHLHTDLSFIPNAGHFNKAAGYTEFPELIEKIKPYL